MDDAEQDPVADPVSSRPITLSYIVPAHNSTAILETTLGALLSRLSGRGAEIVVVENGSSDGTQALLHRIAQSWSNPDVPLVVLSSGKGLGYAYRTGIAASRGARILLTADDLPFGFDDLEAADRLDSEAHPVIIGSKGHRDSEVGRGVLRWVLSWGFWLLRRALLGMRTLDPQGTFVLDGDWARTLVPRLDEPGYLVTTELCYLAEREGIQPLEVPVRLVPGHGDHRSRIAVQDVWRMGVGLIGIRRRHSATLPARAWLSRSRTSPGHGRSSRARAPGVPARRSRAAWFGSGHSRGSAPAPARAVRPGVRGTGSR
jgi:dolichyl-phosphate beta-glucosyltransferase